MNEEGEMPLDAAIARDTPAGDGRIRFVNFSFAVSYPVEISIFGELFSLSRVSRNVSV